MENTICKPIDTLTALYQYMSNPPQWGTLTIPIASRSKVIKNIDLYDGSMCHVDKRNVLLPPRYDYGFLPKTLVCHDMKNGYHDDSFIYDTENFEAYCFYHWAAIDMFVYFSHHFITIPPLGWINVAHKHGVQIMGTIITEWKEGFQQCQEFLKSEEDMQKFISHLISLAKYFKIDGWLINIENEVKDVKMLMKFVKNLTTRMHLEIPNSVVIWYDSVTNKGSLDWQNSLNKLNMDFFNVSDGIFLNYGWTESHLQKSIENAGKRKLDVYVGVDVWGRNFWGGGCFNTAEAIKVIHQFGLSMAIFAPAWTHENINFEQLMNQQWITEKFKNTKPCSTKALELKNVPNKGWSSHDVYYNDYFIKCAVREHFILRNNALWNTIWPYLNTRGPSQLPFQTFFCLGSGNNKKSSGEVVTSKPWFNLKKQQYQLSIPSCSNEFILEEIKEPPKTEPQNTNQNDSNTRINSIEEATIPNNELVVETIVKVTHTDANSFLPKSCNNDEVDFENTNYVKVCNSTNPCSETIEENINSKNVDNLNAISLKAKKPPIRRFNAKPNVDKISCINSYNEDSYTGGSCIEISCTNSNSDGIQEISRLFLSEFLCDYNFIIYYIVKPLVDPMQDLNLLLTLRNNNTSQIFHVVLSVTKSDNMLNTNGEIIVNPISETNEATFKTLQKNLLSSYPDFYIPTENGFDWKIRYFTLCYRNTTILEISSELAKKTGSVLLGGLGIVNDIIL